jgi:nucleotide-binding universal stress UspA family protein
MPRAGAETTIVETEGGSMKTILLAYNGTDSSKRALERTAELAGLYGAKVVVTSVVPVVVGAAPDEPDPELQRARELLTGRGVEPELVNAYGEPAEAILQVADAHEAELIVVGTREPSQVERMLGHSVSEAVQRMAHCDVLIVH